jgi:hypothetical protein
MINYREVKKMPDADSEPIIPPGSTWRHASHSKVNEIPPLPPYNVPIEQIEHTPAHIEVHKTDYPNGVMFVNENQRPDHHSIERAHAHPQHGREFIFEEVPPGQNMITVIIPNNVGWPTGRIIKFRD